MNTVKSFAKFAGCGEILKDFSAPKPAKAKPHPLKGGVRSVMAMCEASGNTHTKALFALQGLLGLRVSEARSIKPEHFDLIRMTLTVRGKGDKERIVPVTRTAWMYIDPAYSRASVEGGRLVELSDRGARKAVTAMGQRLDFDRPISSHDLRATCATELLNRTGNIRAAQELLGHSSVTTTEIYTDVSQDDIRRGLEYDVF